MGISALARLSDVIVDHPRLILLCVALLTLPALEQLIDFEKFEPKLDIDPSMEALLPRSGDALKVLQQTRQRFATDDLLFVAWTTDDLFSPERLAGLKRLTRRIQRLPGVIKVESLATALNIRAHEAVTKIDPFLQNLPADQAAADRLREEALANPLFSGHLVSADGRGALLAIQFEPALDTRTLIELVDRISEASRDEARGIRQFVSGPLFVRLEISRVLLRDLYRIMPLAVLGTLIVAALGFRSLRGVLIPLIANTVALIGTLVCFVATGHALNFVTIILPPVVYVVGFAYAIHVVSDFERNFTDSADRKQAVRAALADVFMPLTLTAFTTAAGFASLALSDIDSIKVFGLYAALGVLLAWMSSLTVAPAAMVLLPAGRRHDASTDRLTAVAPRLARFDSRFRRLLLIGATVLAIASLAAASRIEVSTEVLRNFSEDSEIQRNFEEIGNTFSGGVPLRILVESSSTDAFKDPAHLRVIAALQTWLEAQVEIGAVVSLVDYIENLHQALAPEVAAIDPIPATARLTNHLLLLGGSDEIRRFSDAKFSSTLLHVSANTVATRDLVALVDRINTRLTALPEELQGQVTGTSFLIAKTIDDITRGQIRSLAAALGVIYLVLVVFFGSFRIGALALVPNALPILIYFGILGLSPITLNITTSLVASAVLGIAVDDSIHLLSRYSREARRAMSTSRAVENALAAVIRPVTLTTASLCVGFLAVTAGELQSQVEFGLLAAATLFVAWILDLTFTPALCGRLYFFTLWEILSVDLGTAPHRTLPLLSGLSRRETHIVALMGRLQKYDEGAAVWRHEDPEPEIGLVLNVELAQATVNGASGDEHDPLHRGALIGAMPHSKGLHGPAIDARSNTRVLWLSADCLERIHERYPRIAHHISSNQDGLLADRI